jgi:site-specific DNA recombinase
MLRLRRRSGVDATNRPICGKRRVNDAEAIIVRRIFRDYAAGRSPRAIAKLLNGEQIAGPSGKSWTASTIHGNAQRGTGILNNELYVGRMMWNRLRYVKDPETGKRVSKLNPESQWITTEVPELRIIEPALWQEVKHHQAELALPDRSRNIRNALNSRHRAQYLLSGLLTCGVCGAGYTVAGGERYACADHVNRGACSNTRTIARKEIERRVLAGIKDKLLTPDVIAVFVREFTEEWNRRTAQSGRDRARLQSEIADVSRRLSQVMHAIESGIVTATTKERLLELEGKRDQLKTALNATTEASCAPALHPNLAELYRRKVSELETALDNPAIRGEAALALRALVDRVVLHPGEKRAELHGALAALMSLGENKSRTSRDMRLSDLKQPSRRKAPLVILYLRLRR